MASKEDLLSRGVDRMGQQRQEEEQENEEQGRNKRKHPTTEEEPRTTTAMKSKLPTESPGTTSDRAKKKAKQRNIIDVQGISVDENDYNVLRSLMPKGASTTTCTRYFTKNFGFDMRRDDKHRRIRRLFISFEDIINPSQVLEALGELTALEELRLQSFREACSLSSIAKLQNLTHLSLEFHALDEHSIPSSIGELRNLTELELSHPQGCCALPTEIGSLPRLTKLTLNCHGKPSPLSMGMLKNLKELGLINCTGLSEDIGNLTSLKVFWLYDAHVNSFPASLGNLTNLEEIKIEGEMPEEFGDLTSLKSLTLQNFSRNISVPPSIGKLKNLEALDFSFCEGPHTLPEEIGDLTRLKLLNLKVTKIESLPASIGNLKNLVCLNLCDCKEISELPEAIGDLTSLKFLLMRDSGIESLPASVGNLKNLIHLDLGGCGEISELPEAIGDLTSLYILNFVGTSIKSIPKSIGRLKKILYLRIGKLCKWDSLPEEIGNLTFLTKLSLGDMEVDESSSGSMWIWNLRMLECIRIGELTYKLEEGNELEKYLLNIVQHRFPFLSKLDIGTYLPKAEFTRTGIKNLNEALMSNLLKMQFPFFFVDENGSKESGLVPKLWPSMLCNAKEAFKEFHHLDSNGHYPSDRIGKTNPDSIHSLLTIGIESFLKVVDDRRSKDKLMP